MEVPTPLYDSLHGIAVAESRTLTSVVEQLLSRAMSEQRSAGTTAMRDSPELDCFSNAAGKAVTAAAGEARHLWHGSIGPEHLLAALAGTDGGEADLLLTSIGVTHERVLDAMQAAMSNGKRRPSAPLRYTTRARRVLALARQESDDHGMSPVEPTHVVIGLLREAEGMHLLGLDGHDLNALKNLTERYGVSLAEVRRRLT